VRLILSVFGVLIMTAVGSGPHAAGKPWIVAHRGASAYAPENTVPAFLLAAQQGAMFVEFDLRLTKDRELVCLHDDSLERTTDVEEVFPDRGREVQVNGKPRKKWLLEDFTLAELRRLDAGAWLDPKFKDTRLPTFAETIAALKGKSGLFIELKSPELYPGIERLIMDDLEKAGLSKPGADPKTPVLLQSFTASSLEIFARDLKTTLPIHFLFSTRDAPKWVTPDALARLKTYVTGLSPEKTALAAHADAFKQARAMGLRVTPYTFRASSVTGYPDVTAEMRHYLELFSVDGLITDNPDLAP
jgi:glycerophosphoryl diester phosphodiesterase